MTMKSLGTSSVAVVALLCATLVNAADLPQPARAMINSRCVECHDSDSKKGGLDLTTLAVQLDDPVLEARWTLVHDRVMRGEMPPKDKSHLSPTERDTFLKSMGGFLAAHDAARQSQSGRVVLRRLNRVEYENTVHDLLDIQIPLADMLPEDATADGFDNVSQALRLSVTQIESYLQAADKALDAAINLERDPRLNLHFSMLDMPHMRDILDRPHGMTNNNGTRNEQRFAERDGALILFQNQTFGPMLMRQAHANYTGLYHVRASMFPVNNPGHPTVVARWMVNDFFKDRTLAELDLTPGQERIADFTVWIQKGWMLTLAAYGLNETAPDGTTLRQVGGEKFEGPGIGIRWVEFQGPLLDTWPPPSVARVFGNVPTRELKRQKGQRVYELVPANPPADADKAIMAFATRAFRRPVTTKDASSYLHLAHEALDQGVPFENAVRRACKAILTSPEFLFLQENKGPLDDYALASRLSYFLWSTMPDDQLLELAAKGKLKDPAVLRAQTDRMLADPRGHALAKNFCGQWLNLRSINATMPDSRLYPEFDLLLRDAMVGETEAFFEEMLRSDLAVKSLIDSDFAMLNRRIAEHYGIPGVVGEQFHKVPLPPGSHRGGILTQASILKVTANGTVTSPVVRGAWVVRRILGRQLQPPPPNAGSIEPDTRGATTIREQLDKHRHMASCAVCHQYIDPPGFALESYDVIGGWRPFYRVLGNVAPIVPLENRTTGKPFNVRKGPPVECAGQLTDGRAFTDIDQLKKLLLDQQESIARNVTNNLITYATGAGVSFADREAVDEILRKSQPGGYGLRTLLHGVIQSRLFRDK